MSKVRGAPRQRRRNRQRKVTKENDRRGASASAKCPARRAAPRSGQRASQPARQGQLIALSSSRAARPTVAQLAAATRGGRKRRKAAPLVLRRLPPPPHTRTSPGSTWKGYCHTLRRAHRRSPTCVSLSHSIGAVFPTASLSSTMEAMLGGGTAGAGGSVTEVTRSVGVAMKTEGWRQDAPVGGCHCCEPPMCAKQCGIARTGALVHLADSRGDASTDHETTHIWWNGEAGTKSHRTS